MKTRHIMVHCLSIPFLFVLVLTACSPASTPLPSSFTDAVSGKVDVGSYELYYSCAGKGGPTVILEAGGPSESSVWDLVRVYMGSSPRVCAYDRANLGKSDSAPKPRTFADMTRDLHTLLQNVPIEGPYVLVGHSMGGMLVQLYASQYPEDVVGLVLVDSGHPDMGDRLLAMLPVSTVVDYAGALTFDGVDDYAVNDPFSNAPISETMTTNSAYRPTSISAGRNAASYMSPTERPSWSASTISTSDGGII